MLERRGENDGLMKEILKKKKKPEIKKKSLRQEDQYFETIPGHLVRLSHN